MGALLLYTQINQVLLKHEETVSDMMRTMGAQIQELDAMRDSILPVLKGHEERLRAGLIDAGAILPGTPSRAS